MDISEIVLLIILSVLALTAFIISFRQFSERGFCFNNAYIFASEEQRKKWTKSLIISSQAQFLF